jgi:hypothetical protein
MAKSMANVNGYINNEISNNVNNNEISMVAKMKWRNQCRKVINEMKKKSENIKKAANKKIS